MSSSTRDRLSMVVPIAAGLLFGAGLALGGMTDPARVRGFLDVLGAWDPTLVFVLAGAVGVMAVAWRIQLIMTKPVFAGSFAIPDRTDLTPHLVGGSALFGIGWGIAGLCPGPAIASLAINPIGALVFVVAMLVGMVLARLIGEP